ncbi:YoaK family protein [Paludisphaera soli]|uniref:YoaK family protein n=1 Tax=Paludisphaera soli TaxID=2712865 RepID=UPI0013EA5422|nr:YoaK family protein [Paludisphaera soli]
MRTDVFKNVFGRRNQFLWLSLAFQAGFMNAGGFLACGRFVSHVTGYGTYAGVALGQRDYLIFFEMALAPAFFCMGAVYAGWLVDRRLLLGVEPLVERGILTLALANVVIWLAEISGYLGQFGEPLELQGDVFLLFALCFACGLQNGLFTGLTSGQVRTTHLTGPTTDLGLTAAKIWTLPRDDERRRPLVLANWLRTKIIVAFTGGSMIAVLVFPFVTHEGFAFPAVLSLFLAWYVRWLLHHGDGGEPPEEV